MSEFFLTDKEQESIDKVRGEGSYLVIHAAGPPEEEEGQGPVDKIGAVFLAEVLRLLPQRFLPVLLRVQAYTGHPAQKRGTHELDRRADRLLRRETYPFPRQSQRQPTTSLEG